VKPTYFWPVYPCVNKRTPDQIADESLLLKIAVFALRLGRKCMSDYGHEFSPQRFTQAQLFACVIMREVLRTTYRGVIERLALMPKLREAIGLDVLPHYTTLQKFSARKDVPKIVDKCLKQLVKSLNLTSSIEAGIDSTGIETTGASAHFVARSGRKRGRFVKASMIIVCGLLLPAALVLSWGPGPDIVQAVPLAQKAAGVIKPLTLWGDKGYDSDDWHEFCREGWGVTSYAPARQCSPQGLIRGKHRWMMGVRWPGYGRRWGNETAHSTMKRTTGSSVAGRSSATMLADAAIKVLAYALRV
jgi:Transposase DDE domain